jgi:hypothetical protein
VLPAYFTKTLDAALLNNRIDIAVHSMKDVPTQMAQGIQQAAVLKRASHKDIFVYKDDSTPPELGLFKWRLVFSRNDTHHSPLTLHHCHRFCPTHCPMAASLPNSQGGEPSRQCQHTSPQGAGESMARRHICGGRIGTYSFAAPKIN